MFLKKENAAHHLVSLLGLVFGLLLTLALALADRLLPRPCGISLWGYELVAVFFIVGVRVVLTEFGIRRK